MRRGLRWALPLLFIGSLGIGLGLGLGRAAEAARIVIKVAPPVPRHEVVVVRPGPTHVWVGGYWNWAGAEYVWVPGAWQLPPRPRAVWKPGHYRHVPGGHEWIPGHWR